MWHNLKLFFPISKKNYYQQKAWVTLWYIISSNKVKKEREKLLKMYCWSFSSETGITAPTLQTMASAQPVTSLWERTWKGPQHLPGTPASHVFSHSQGKQQTHLQRSEKQWVSVLDLKAFGKQSYSETIITESLPRERRGFARRGSGSLRPSPWPLHQPSWHSKGTRQGYSQTPGPTVTNSLTSSHHPTTLLCGHHSCHTAEKQFSSFKALSKFEGWGLMKSKLPFGVVFFFLIERVSFIKRVFFVVLFPVKLTHSTNPLLKEDIFKETLTEDTLIKYEQTPNKQHCCKHKAGNYITG